MSMSDPVADMLTRLRNANSAGKPFVDVPASKVLKGIVSVLKEEGFVRGFEVIDDNRQGIIRIVLKYGPDGEKIFSHMKRVSKPGCRVYKRASDVPVVLAGLGIAVISTNLGVMSDRQARRKKVGGELICTVY